MHTSQRKFNLLREESEGYAKVITLLCRSGPAGLSEATADATVCNGSPGSIVECTCVHDSPTSSPCGLDTATQAPLSGWQQHCAGCTSLQAYVRVQHCQWIEGFHSIAIALPQHHSVRCPQMSELKALIGYFDLDPNRVAQIVHLAYAAQPGNATFQRLLVPGALFSADAVCFNGVRLGYQCRGRSSALCCSQG